MIKKSGIFLAIIFMAIASGAYLPTTEYILSRSAENAPRVPLAVEYAVQFENGPHQYSTRETWVFADNGQMKFKVSQGFQLDISYTGAERAFNDKQGRKTQKLSAEYLERLHFLKTPDSYVRIMNEQGVSRERIQNPHLSRGAGVVNYGFFERAPLVNGQKVNEALYPGLWIEQDQFLFRQMRFRTQALFQVDDYLQVGKFFFPKQKTIIWGKNTVRIKTISVVEKKNLRPQDLQIDTTLDMSTVPPEIKPTVLEFYSRFR